MDGGKEGIETIRDDLVEGASPNHTTKQVQAVVSESCPCRAIESGSVDSESIAVGLSLERLIPHGLWFE